MTENQALALRTKMLGAMLRDSRENAGMSMKDAAERIATSSSTMSSYEHGRKGISLPELEILAFEFDTSLHQFWTDTPPTLQERVDIDPEVMLSLRHKMIGAQLRQHREEAGLTIKQLADSVDFPTSRVGAYERGERSIPLPELEAMLEVLGRPVDEYVDTEGPIGRWLKDQRAIQAYLDLPEEMRDFLGHPENLRYLELAKRLSEMSIEKLRRVGEILLELTL